MHLASLVDMIESAFCDRALLTHEAPVDGALLAALARGGAAELSGRCGSVVYAGENHPMLPVALLASACAGVPFVPVNYRLDDQQLDKLIARQPEPFVIADATTLPRITTVPARLFDDWLNELPEGVAPDPPSDDDDVAIVLYTSGTTSEPKAALLRHRHLMAYLLGTVDFGGAGDHEAMLVSVPPYHVAGVANMLSNLWAGRRLVYLPHFDPSTWLSTVRREAITHAMVVPTMLARIVDVLDGPTADVPTLRSLAYGGSKVSERVLRRALEAFPTTGFVNAYGLTETASTIAVLGPDDHRAAVTSSDPAVQRRLSSAGQVLPTIEIEVRDERGNAVPPGVAGMIFLRGEQVAGEYSTGAVLDSDGWFCTRDRGSVDSDGYLFLEGRADDTIIRGGENVAPAEIEDVLLRQRAVAEVCVVGLPDDEWGQRIVAAVVLAPDASPDEEGLRSAVRAELRGARTPDRIVFRDQLPYTQTGKLLRRTVLAELIEDGTAR
ncbi:MAG: fatty acid--CoA ligase family protein [Ilumatobacteraceae bacterium]